MCYHIISRLKSNDTHWLKNLFEVVEEILSNCTSEAETLLAYGLFEDLQTISQDFDIDYRTEFNSWLGPLGKNLWNEVIDFW